MLISIKTLIVAGIAFLAVSTTLAKAETNSMATIGPGFLKTNGEFVTIGDIMIKTNSPGNTDEFKQYRWRVHQLDKFWNSRATNATDQLVKGAWALARDFPDYPNGYEDIMAATEDYEYNGQVAKARALAHDLAASSAPERFRIWANGSLNRLNSFNNLASLQFTAVDGRKVDTAKMKGEVVLVDFWATDCGPCVAELPGVKAAYDKFHDQGFEVIGISCDTDKAKLERFLKEKGYPWPQYFDGKQQEENKFTQQFGIDGIPHMFLLDKNGILRFDIVRAGDRFHPKGDTTSLEQKIEELLAEN